MARYVTTAQRIKYGFLAVLLILVFGLAYITTKSNHTSYFTTIPQSYRNAIAMVHTEEVTTFIEWPDLVQDVPYNYPKYDSLLNIVKNWNPDDPDPPTHFTETLQHFNYSCPKERSIARLFLEAEIPFKLYDVPEINNVVDKWTDEYLLEEMKSVHPRVEKSTTNHFMFFHPVKSDSFVPPQELVQMSFDEWLLLSKKADAEKLGKDSVHYYFTTGVERYDKATYIGKDLDIFSTRKENFFVRHPEKNKGIQCRFGMRLVILFLLLIFDPSNAFLQRCYCSLSL
jgi:hypothetical protein